LEESVSILRPLGEEAQRETAHAALFLGLGTLYFGEDPRAARGLLQESLALFEGLNDPWGVGRATCVLGEATLAKVTRLAYPLTSQKGLEFLHGWEQDQQNPGG
jgi:hypothetical protein